VIDSLTGGLAATDVHGRVLMFNRAAETITGETAAAVLGRPIAEVLQMPASMRKSLRDVVEPGRPHRSEFTYIRRSGEQMDLGLSIGPLIGGAGQVGYLFTFQDLTEYKRREREEQRQKRLAAVGEMAAGIAHEIRNPLASMAGSMQVLRQELDLNSEQTQLFDIVLRESDRLNDTIRNFLAYARPQASRIRTVDLKQVLAEAAQLIRNNPECQSRHQVDVTLPDHQVACDADEAQIRQIVWNLATNGIRAMPDGGALTLAATAGASSVVIRVTDTGVGMSVDALDRIFQPFHGGFAKGAGLGLSIVHRIVTDHGGEIRVSSEVGKGTAVEIHLPVRAPSADAAAPAARAEQTMVA
jgi:two-component system sensor histidine kinase PilS (NtrC family)